MPLGFCSVPGCLKWEGSGTRRIYKIPNARHSTSEHDSFGTVLTPSATLQLERRSQWLKVLGIISPNECENYVICSRHFVSGKPAKVSQVKDVDWVPTLYLPNPETTYDGACSDSTYKDCSEKLDVASSAAEKNRIKGTSEQASSEDDIYLGASGGSDQDLKGNPYEFNKILAEKNKLSARCETLQNQLHDCQMLLMASEEDQRILLEKYKEGQLTIDRFRISENTFLGNDNKIQYMTGLPNYEVLMCLFTHIEPHIKDVPSLSKFQQYILTLMRLRLAMDCKFLGAIALVSEGFGGRSSDKMVTERSKLLENLLPGDIVLAIKGFTIHEMVRECHAEIYMPAFKKAGVKQMSATEVEQSRMISNLRIHVERLIAVLKMKFKVWSTTLPIEFFHGDDEGPPVIDKMMKVCCALVNANASVVPLF